jgi:hypothetical protein
MSTDPPKWLATRLPHLWLPYAQMQTVVLPVPGFVPKGIRTEQRGS